jgi:ribosomal protein S18 acetylase RimI-like enzyme
MQFELQQEHYRRAFEGAETSIVLLAGDPAGSLIVQHTAEGIRLVDIALLPEVRGRGIGRTLIQRLLERARVDGKPVRLQVTRGNPALRLYADLGFERIGESEIYFEMEWLPIEDPPLVP